MDRKRLTFGVAESADEFEQIFRLNHETFAREIPQHAGRADGRLVDRFHSENTYIVCRLGDELIGMIALRAKRPFSLDAKLPDLDRHLPAGRSICELRLLAVKPGHRRGTVLAGLIRELVRVGRGRGLDYAVISGTTRQLKLYAHLGFEAFGPLVGTHGAQFQPMRLPIERFTSKVAWLDDSAVRDGGSHAPLSLQPGLAETSARVRAAAAQRPLPHRSGEAARLVAQCREALIRLCGADEVQILVGTGTLANDAIAAQLRGCGGPGAILVNGEFGERLADHARRAGLEFSVHAHEWGRRFDFDALGRELAAGRAPKWVWMVHCETSTGVMNDPARLKEVAQALGAQIALDCVSTIGNLELDLNGVAFASGVSGKGLAALAGLAFVFHRSGERLGGEHVPRYLDLALYAQNASVPFTHSTVLLEALRAALAELDPASYRRRAAIGAAVRAALAAHGFDVFGDAHAAAPFVVTVALPPEIGAEGLAGAMLARGYRIAYESRYLRERNWIQLAWMGQVDREAALEAVAALAQCREGIRRPGATAQRAA
jgi:aspartate aminotransferase-like enzyme